MKIKIIVLSWFICSGCTLIGFGIGTKVSYYEESVEKIEQEDDVRVILKNQIEEDGKFVYYDSATIQIEVDSYPPDTLTFSKDDIQHIKKRQWSTPWIFAAIGLVLDYYTIKSLKDVQVVKFQKL